MDFRSLTFAIFHHGFPPESRAKKYAWPAGPASIGLDEEKRQPQPAWSLADNLRANAADRVKAVHSGADNAAIPAAASRPARRGRTAALRFRVSYQIVKIFADIVRS